MHSNELFMKQAISKARKGINRGQSPFGACIVKGKKVIALAHNTVFSAVDSTAHAEINAIRMACRKLKTIDLSGCTIYSTTEPCPMCFAAIHWAKIRKIVFGTSISDVGKLGFSEILLTNRRFNRINGNKMKITSGFMKAECAELLKEWKKKSGKTY